MKFNNWRQFLVNLVSGPSRKWIRDRNEGGWPSFWSLNKRDFWKLVTEQISKNSLYSGFFDFLRHFKHNYTIKAITFTKCGDFSLKYRKFSKFSAPAAPKIGHWTQFFPKISILRRLRCRKSGHRTAKVTPPQCVPWNLWKVSFYSNITYSR